MSGLGLSKVNTSSSKALPEDSFPTGSPTLPNKNKTETQLPLYPAQAVLINGPDLGNGLLTSPSQILSDAETLLAQRDFSGAQQIYLAQLKENPEDRSAQRGLQLSYRLQQEVDFLGEAFFEKFNRVSQAVESSKASPRAQGEQVRMQEGLALLARLDQLDFIDTHSGRISWEPVQAKNLRKQILQAIESDHLKEKLPALEQGLGTLERYQAFLQRKYQLRQELLSHLPAYVQQEVEATGDYSLIKLYYTRQDPSLPMDWPLNSVTDDDGHRLSTGLNDSDLLVELRQAGPEINAAMPLLQAEMELAQPDWRIDWNQPLNFEYQPNTRPRFANFEEYPTKSMEELAARLEDAEAKLDAAPFEKVFATIQRDLMESPVFQSRRQVEAALGRLSATAQILDKLNEAVAGGTPPPPEVSEKLIAHLKTSGLIQDSSPNQAYSAEQLQQLYQYLGGLQALELRSHLIENTMNTTLVDGESLDHATQVLSEVNLLFGGKEILPEELEFQIREQNGIADLRQTCRTLLNNKFSPDTALGSLTQLVQRTRQHLQTQDRQNLKRSILVSRSQMEKMKAEVGQKRFLRDRRGTGVYDYVLGQYDAALAALEKGEDKTARAIFFKTLNGSHQGAVGDFGDYQRDQRIKSFTVGAGIVVASGLVGGLVGGAIFGADVVFGSGTWFASVAVSGTAFWATHHLGRALVLGDLPPWYRYIDGNSPQYSPERFAKEIGKDALMNYGMFLFLGTGMSLYESAVAAHFFKPRAVAELARRGISDLTGKEAQGALKHLFQAQKQSLGTGAKAAYFTGAFGAEYATFTGWDAVALQLDSLWAHQRLAGKEEWNHFLAPETFTDRAIFLAALKTGNGIARNIISSPGFNARRDQLIAESARRLEAMQAEALAAARNLEDSAGKLLFPNADQFFAGAAVGADGNIRFPGIYMMENQGEGPSSRGAGESQRPAGPASEIRRSNGIEIPGDLPPLPEIEPVTTYPQTAARQKPKWIYFGAAEDAKPEPINNLMISNHILTGASGLKPVDALHYSLFVLDRVGDFPELLRPFALPPETKNLESALSWFTDGFSNEQAMKDIILKEAKVGPADGSLERPLNHPLLMLMRTSKDDAADYLARLGQLRDLEDPAFRTSAEGTDPSRMMPQSRYSLEDWELLRDDFPELTEEVLKEAYGYMVRSRVLNQTIYKHYLRDEFAFAVTDAGHEVQGTAAAIAMAHEVNPASFAISPHYRGGTLVGTWTALRGYPHFIADYIRQQLSKITDKWSKGRQTASHFNDQEHNILPGQSEVGRNITKAVGYARSLQQEGHNDAVVYAELGDGSMALSDFHEAMTGAALMGFNTKKLPVVIGVVDNGMAISVEPSSGRAICDMAAYAKAFGADFYVTDGNDFLDVYQNYRVALGKAKARQRPAIIWVQNLPRLNNHSSAAQFQFDLGQHDPLVDFGQEMVREGLLETDQVMLRNAETVAGNFFNNYQLGAIAQREQREIDETWEAVAQEPDPTLEQTKEDVRLEFPYSREPDPTHRQTQIIINGAIRAALRDTIEDNPLTWVNGQDTGMKGGVMQATAGLWELFPKNVTDAPINEPAIMWIALGYALNEKAIAFPEIQFGDYSTSGLHAMVHAGGLLWTSGGSRRVNWNLRLPVEPGIYGAVYHSTPLEGLYAAIPGMTIVAPSTSRDAYGLIRSAAEYAGPVMIFEPKKLYRLPVGDAFPNEPADPEAAKEKYKSISIHRGIPDIPRDFRVPLGKAAIRRFGKDLTIVTWGLSHYYSLNALKPLREAGISVELIDLRTIVPPDMETVLKSVAKTGRLLVVHQDRVFSSLGREIQGAVHEALPGAQIHSRVLGMEPVPGIPQARPMEDAVMVREEDIVRAATELMKR